MLSASLGRRACHRIARIIIVFTAFGGKKKREKGDGADKSDRRFVARSSNMAANFWAIAAPIVRDMRVAIPPRAFRNFIRRFVPIVHREPPKNNIKNFLIRCIDIRFVRWEQKLIHMSVHVHFLWSKFHTWFNYRNVFLIFVLDRKYNKQMALRARQFFPLRAVLSRFTADNQTDLTIPSSLFRSQWTKVVLSHFIFTASN